jgi:putative FmdB family regulatory protein
MPLYSFRCSAGHRDTRFAKIADRDAPCTCACGQSLTRLFDAPAIRPEISEYLSPVTGQPISSRAQRREDLRRTNSLEWEPGIREDCARRQAESTEAAYRSVEATIDKTVAEMHASNLL